MNATRVLLPLSLPHLYRAAVAHQSRDLPITHAQTAVFHGPSSGAIRIAASECPLPRSYLSRTLVRSHLLRHLHFLGRYRPRGEKKPSGTMDQVHSRSGVVAKPYFPTPISTTR